MKTLVNRTALLGTVVVLLSAGCVDGSGEPSGSTPQDDAAEEPEQGGPVADEEDGEPVLDVGGVRTEATENDTIELSTKPSGEEDPVEGTEWEPRLRITFDSAQRGDDGVTFTGEAEYLHDEGGYELHSNDFEVLVPKAPEDLGGQGEFQAQGEGGEFTDHFDVYTTTESEELVTLTSEEPAGEFSVTIADVPLENEEEAVGGGHYGRMVQYVTPDELWGHTVEAPPDFVPGRVCYVEGEDWHDIELFLYTELPCDTL